MKRVVWLMAMTVVAAACGMGGDGEAGGGEAGADCEPGVADGDLNLYNWSEYIDPSLITQFEEEMGVAVTETFFDSNETMLAQIDAGGAAYDLIVPSDYMVQTMIEGELLIPLNRDAIPNIENLDPEFTGLPFDPDGAYSVPYQWGTTGPRLPARADPRPEPGELGGHLRPRDERALRREDPDAQRRAGDPGGRTQVPRLLAELDQRGRDQRGRRAGPSGQGPDRHVRQRRLRRPADVGGDRSSPTASTATSSSRSTRRTPGRPSATRCRSRGGPSGWTTWRSR